jgi:hypothetical protein
MKPASVTDGGRPGGRTNNLVGTQISVLALSLAPGCQLRRAKTPSSATAMQLKPCDDAFTVRPRAAVGVGGAPELLFAALCSLILGPA